MEPGGWLEFQELDSEFYSQDRSLKDDNKVHELRRLQQKALSRLGRKLNVVDDVKELLLEHGFHSIEHRRFPVPLGMWPKRKTLVWLFSRRAHFTNKSTQKTIGLLRHNEFSAGLPGQTLKPFCKELGKTPEEVKEYLSEVLKDIGKRGVHMMSTL